MVRLKKIDVYGQISLIVVCILIAVFLPIAVLLSSYFVLATYQFISLGLHLYLFKNEPKHKEREAFEWFVLIASLTLPFGSYILLVALSPVTASWYLFISYKELRIWEARQLIQFR